MIQIRFSDSAKQDLRDIWHGLAEYSGLSFADSTLANIESKFRLLAQFPSSGRVRAELLVDLRSYPFPPLSTSANPRRYNSRAYSVQVPCPQ
jgi:plasmid stabilization system protein ParE